MRSYTPRISLDGGVSFKYWNDLNENDLNYIEWYWPEIVKCMDARVERMSEVLPNLKLKRDYKSYLYFYLKNAGNDLVVY